MTRLLPLILTLLLVTSFANAQSSGILTATLTDSTTKEPILGAIVELISTKNADTKKVSTSGYQGKVSMPSITYGEYHLKISFIGYESLERTININKQTLALGALEIKQTSQQIDDVVLEVQAIRTSQKGDTVVYNANAFKVAKDADAEGLLSKMPGITIIDGSVEAQGETVKKVYVDGKEFFGNDVSATIKNLPAEIIEKIEVYNKLSDQAEFTGIDDGQGYKAINIVTMPTMRIGQFGKIYGGYGFNDKYIAGTSLNFFTGNHRFSFIGLFNNINQQNFSTEDILGAMGGSGGMSSRGGGHMRGGGGMGNFMISPQKGISTVSSLGVNYSGQWWEKVDFQGSYFFNASSNDNASTIDRQYYSDNETARLYNSSSSSSSSNYNHRLNARISYKINENNSLMMRPNLSFQSYNSNSSSFGQNSNLTNSQTSVVNILENMRDAESTGYNISNSIMYRVKLGKPGRTITVDANGSWSKNDNDNISIAQTTTMLPIANDTVTNQHILNYGNGYRLDGSIIYTEPISDISQVSIQYRPSYNYSDADKKSYLYDYIDKLYGPNFDPELSNIYNSGYLIQRVGPGYRISSEKTMFSANIFYQRSSLVGDQSYPIVSDPRIKASFDNITYFAMMNQNFNATNGLRISLRSSTNNPSVSQLQDVVDISNPQFVSAGNPNLKPTYTHDFSGTYTLSSITKGQTFMFMFGASTRSNYIGDSTVISSGEPLDIVNGNGDLITLQPNAQFTRPTNMDGYWNVRSMVSFGTPLNFIKSNINLSGGVTYNRAPSIINGINNTTTGTYYNAGAVLGSNINEKIDFTLSYNGGYNITSTSFSAKGTNKNNKYISQSASLRFKWVAWAGFTLSGNAGYSQYRGITDSFTEEYIMCNLYLGKKLFKNQRGEITFGVNDLLNQNQSFSRNITDTYIENQTNKVMGRYLGLQFVYNLRNFGSSKPSSGTGEPESIHRERRGGPPAGSMPRANLMH